MTFADKAIRFNKLLNYTGSALPPGIRIMNPFTEFEQTMGITESFYRKYYNDNKPRHLILGINPSRLGAGLTGIPFTDPKRLMSKCHIAYEGKITHEPSSVFIYEMIKAYGGIEAFYGDFYINSPCPLGFTSIDINGREKNYNYYDSKELINSVKDFMIDSIHQLIDLGIHTDICFCFGTGKNEKFLSKLNEEHHFFKKIIALEHPRFIMQYKNSEKQFYIDKYISAFESIKQ
ncbi:MAG: SMUG2 DNA glycosylase family protein [Candidatus Pedobacter colombiensis]|uniref:SMUG2 DNA glycosylase family protein n=1 Tax=Candidatus Pedobacter colombiensis TaxID=3121371 RepID=A0AAJ6B7M6_9SPHI|nr:SMUG2 DNA glycosylase family protein [Pedobacter sp.]WEK18228.1 MAG: SMUG2 DNA glycosylase family protein [Pedobacter sp.]